MPAVQVHDKHCLASRSYVCVCEWAPAPIATRVVDGVSYFEVVNDAGWTTGPCATVEAAQERLAAWLRGDEISEACDGMASVLQMEATAAFFTRMVPKDGGRMQALVCLAFTDGLHSDAWIRATVEVVTSLIDEPEIEHAGGARIRRAA